MRYKKPKTVVVIGLIMLAGFFYISDGLHESEPGYQKNYPETHKQGERVAATIEPSFTDMATKKPAVSYTSQGTERNEFSIEEKSRFVAGIAEVFGQRGLSNLDQRLIKKSLITLNQSGAKGLRALLELLRQPARTDKEVLQRFAYIDYLNYRMKWDSNAIEVAKTIVLANPPDETANRYLAANLVDKSEIVSGLALVDLSLALDVLELSNNSYLKKHSCVNIFIESRERRVDYDLMARIKTVCPKFEGRINHNYALRRKEK